MSAGKLLLHPVPDPEPPPDPQAIAKLLRELGCIGPELPALGRNHFRAGNRFLQLLSFLGCSPHVKLEAPAHGGSDFCFLALLGPWHAPRLVHGRNTRPPGCPVCNNRNRRWRELLLVQDQYPPTQGWKCEACGAHNPPGEWNWRQQAGAGRFFVMINDIFPSEAVPSRALLDGLARQTGSQWGYFYIQD